jgi:hypothetical protein
MPHKNVKQHADRFFLPYEMHTISRENNPSRHRAAPPSALARTS